MPQAKAEIIATTRGTILPNTAQIIEAAGRTCYKSDAKINNESAEKFLDMILRRGHESVIEHSWIVFEINENKINPQWLLELMMANNLFSLTHSKLSGNARMFRDLFRTVITDNLWDDIYDSMLNQLKSALPLLFKDIKAPSNEAKEDSGLKLANENTQYTNKEQLKHWWIAVRFIGGSRTFTHQQVRHRPTAISQESQRYCDEKGFAESEYYVVPPSIKAAGLREYYQSKMKQIDDWYKELQAKTDSNGKRLVLNEDARFILPNAVCSEIVISGNLEEWRHIFKIRCDSHAQWEIRKLMIQLLPRFQQEFPELFDDFKIDASGQSASLEK